jgi:FKBP-type peptidyl-prolyl cis-trans isomerase
MAYGSQGQGPIPPDAPLAFDVDIVDIHSPS